MKKTAKQIANQCERIMKLYLKGYGTKKMITRVEEIFFSTPQVFNY